MQTPVAFRAALDCPVQRIFPATCTHEYVHQSCHGKQLDGWFSCKQRDTFFGQTKALSACGYPCSGDVLPIMELEVFLFDDGALHAETCVRNLEAMVF